MALMIYRRTGGPENEYQYSVWAHFQSASLTREMRLARWVDHIRRMDRSANRIRRISERECMQLTATVASIPDLLVMVPGLGPIWVTAAHREPSMIWPHSDSLDHYFESRTVSALPGVDVGLWEVDPWLR